MPLIYVIATIFIGFAVFTIFFQAPHSNLIIQSPDEDEIIELSKYLKNHGIDNFAKNLYSQGLVTKRGGPIGDSSLHAVNLTEVKRAKELVETYFKSKK